MSNRNQYLQFIASHSTVFILLLFILVNILFNFRSLYEIIAPNKTEIATGDSTLAEFILENNYQNIINFRNPFIIYQKLFYPFNINLSMNDPGSSNVLFFFVLRPFMDIHQSMLIVVMVNSFLSNVCMYFLLRKLKVSNAISILLGLSFGFMPVAAYRLLGHYTYTSIYIFPLLMLVILQFIDQNKTLHKYILSVVFAFLMALLLLLNFYFFLIVAISLVYYIAYYSITSFKRTYQFFLNNTLFILSSGIVFILLLLPWIQAVLQLKITSSLQNARSIGSAIELSGDLFGFITPSEYNPFYRFIIFFLAEHISLFQGFKHLYLYNWEKFIYPGLFIWGTYIFIAIRYKKISFDIREKMRPHLILSIIFATFLLGPFLKVYGHYFVSLEGIQVLFPLPFLVLQYLPGLSSLRAPTRFTPAFVFLALIITAYIFDRFLMTQKKWKLILALLFFIFFLDQFYILPKNPSYYFPLKAYTYIKKDSAPVTVLQIPFTVRDGFEYIGYVHAISPMNGYFYHQKPVIGGYFARIEPDIFSYYKNLPFIGYVTRIIDKGNFAPLKEDPQPLNITPFKYDEKTVKKELEFLSVKYVLLQADELYSPVIAKILIESGYKRTLQDGNYDLYVGKLENTSFPQLVIGKKYNYFAQVEGFSLKDPQLITANKASVFLKIQSDNYSKLQIIIQSKDPYKKMEVYVNDEFESAILIEPKKKEYQISDLKHVHTGVNRVMFRFPNANKGDIARLFQVEFLP